MILHILAASSLFMLIFFTAIIIMDWYEQGEYLGKNTPFDWQRPGQLEAKTLSRGLGLACYGRIVP